MARLRPFAQVDVFSAEPLRGNPVAVVLDGEDLTEEEMQRFAHWTNLSETTFLLPPTSPAADYRLRIFTPGRELPFAGHPTLGSARAWLDTGGSPQRPGTIVQECGAGLVRIRLEGDTLSFAAPPTTRSGPVDADTLARGIEALGVSPDDVVAHQWVDNGPGWLVVQLPSAEHVLALEPRLALIPDAKVGVIGAHPPGSPEAFEVRAFAASLGVGEDPVTGSLNASVAQWLLRTGAMRGSWTVSQGTRLGRAGRVAITPEGDDLWVGGACTTVLRGTALL